MVHWVGRAAQRENNEEEKRETRNEAKKCGEISFWIREYPIPKIEHATYSFTNPLETSSPSHRRAEARRTAAVALELCNSQVDAILNDLSSRTRCWRRTMRNSRASVKSRRSVVAIASLLLCSLLLQPAVGARESSKG